MEGIVVKFDTKKGFGFIRTPTHSKDIFVHIREVDNQQALSVGQKVTFSTKQTAKGLASINVVPGKKRSSPFLQYGIAAVLVTLLTTAALVSQGQHIILAYILAINVCTFLFYGYDKIIAGSSILRVPEWILHGLSIAGGSPSGLIAQKVFRHKTIKGSFQLAYWGIVVVQIAILFFIQYFS